MPDALVYQALKKLPDWMVDVSGRFDKFVNGEAVLKNKDKHNDESESIIG